MAKGTIGKCDHRWAVIDKGNAIRCVKCGFVRYK